MSLKLRRVGLPHVRTLVGLADGLWTGEGVRLGLVGAGWLAADEKVAWTHGDALEIGDGWELELGAVPPEPDSFVVLPFALLWPPVPVDGEEHDLDEDDEDDLDEDYGDDWERLPEAGAAEFGAEFLRVRGLVEGLIGPPASVHGDLGQGVRWDVWERGATVFTLFAQDDVPSYSHYDRLALGVWDAAGWTPPE
ncbi:hypothetical protein [Actinomadura sp. WAC 06369]|uniref:hypothetical protein n=1 Tax=Actinomadura sp. WAC 06369 TaxID=2203193 RepID=UPI000F7B4B38|nr:hypothetical protein [Actinomadura sp. WAC 06369]